MNRYQDIHKRKDLLHSFLIYTFYQPILFQESKQSLRLLYEDHKDSLYPHIVLQIKHQHHYLTNRNHCSRF